MKKVSIFYFSGTGNTKYVIDILSAELSKSCETTVFNIENPGSEVKAVEAIYKSDLNVFASPVYAFDSPTIMYSFLNKAKRIKKDKTFSGKNAAVLTCPGDPSSMNHIAAKMLSKKLHKLGFEVLREDQIAMPPNIFAPVTVEKGRNMVIEAEKKVLRLVKSYMSGEKNKFKPNAGVYLLYLISKLEHPGAKIFGKLYNVDKEKCVNCGLCVKKCPQKNITVIDGNIKFGWNCIFCMRCVYSCPANAIKNPVKFALVKGGYNLKKYK